MRSYGEQEGEDREGRATNLLVLVNELDGAALAGVGVVRLDDPTRRSILHSSSFPYTAPWRPSSPFSVLT